MLKNRFSMIIGNATRYSTRSVSVRRVLLSALFTIGTIWTGADFDSATADDVKPPQKFQSPFNGPSEWTGPEAKDFDELQDAYDNMVDAREALAAARKCNDETKALEDEYNKWSLKYALGLSRYVRDWSTNLYPKGVPFDKKTVAAFKADLGKLEVAIEKGHKAKPANNLCPPKDVPKIKRPGKKHEFSEDDPRYMENYQPPANLNAPPHRKTNSSENGLPPPPHVRSDDGDSDGGSHNPYGSVPDIPMRPPQNSSGQSGNSY
jgi:hypothetical protein